MGQGGGIYILMKFSTKQVSLDTISVSERMFQYVFWAKLEQNCGESPLLGESPCNDIIILEKHHVLAPKMRRQEISFVMLCNAHEE